jgi:hypothetical protein
LFLLALIATCAVWVVREWPTDRPAAPVPTGGPLVLTDQPAIDTPTVLPAASARLPDEAEVIGVSAGGRHRAYAVSAMRPRRAHVVNDELAGVPVSVTFCGVTGCVRVFTDPDEEGPLDLAVGGLDSRPGRQGMVLRAGASRYRHDSGQPFEAGAVPFPYEDYPYLRTTWGEWRRAHPDTDVFVGEPPDEPGEGGRR